MYLYDGAGEEAADLIVFICYLQFDSGQARKMGTDEALC